MGSRAGGRVTSVNVTGIPAVQAALDMIAKEDLNPAKRELRQGSKRIAQEIVIPAIQDGARGATPISEQLAATARTRTDRIVTVNIGRVNPKLSGYKRGSKQRWRTALAYGSDRGPHPAAKRNRYGVPRNERGYYVLPTIASTGTFEKVRTAYRELLAQILRDYGAFR